jgi:hypothetical protein
MPFLPDERAAILFAVVFFSFIAVVVIAIVAAGVIKRKKEIEAYKDAIEKGLPLADLKLARSPVATFKSGLVWMAIGIGLFVVILAQGGTRALAVSVIPTLIGVALIVSYMVEKRAAG